MFPKRKASFILFFLLVCGCIFVTKANTQPPGKAITLDGATQLISVNTGSKYINGDFTVEAWVKPGSSTKSMMIFSTKHASKRKYDSYFELGLAGGDTILCQFHGVGVVTDPDQDPYEHDVPFIYKAGTWYHIAVVASAPGFTIYVNGEVVSAGHWSLPPPGLAAAILLNPQDYVRIGSYRSSQLFKGSIDEVRVYDTILARTDIQADMRSTAISIPAHLQLYYNFDESPGVDTIKDYSPNHFTGTINRSPFAFDESYAMVMPIATAATGITDTGFTANWLRPITGTVANFVLDVATDSAFTSLVTGYDALPVTGIQHNVTGLTPGTQYYYRVRANKLTVAGQGAFSKTIIVGKTRQQPTINTFNPKTASTDSTVTIYGTNFTGAMAVTFGGTPAARFRIVSSTTIKAVLGAGASGNVAVITAGGKAFKQGFNFNFIPHITSFAPVTATAGDTVIITGTNLMDASAVSFGGTPASSFNIISSTSVAAVVGTGASGNVSVTTPGGVATSAGFIFSACPPVTPSVSISINTSDSICLHTAVTFTATPEHGGSAPAYQWVKNMINVGTNSSAYVDNTLQQSDSVWCILTSSAACATPANVPSNHILFSVSQGPADQPKFLTGPDNITLNEDARFFIRTPSNKYWYIWTVTPAGVEITTGQGTGTIRVHWGVASSGTVSVVAHNFCGASPAAAKSVTFTGKPAIVKGADADGLAKNELTTATYVRTYPNPVTSVATIEFAATAPGKYQAALVDARGQVINTKTGTGVTGNNKIMIDMSACAPGVYYVRLLDAAHTTRVIKLIKTNK